jgi:hypothetical protein
MESWQQPCGPDDLVELTYLGLNFVFGGRVSEGELLDCARDVMERTTFYRSQWVAGKPFEDVHLAEGPAAHVGSVLKENRGIVICTFQIGPFLQLPFLLAKMGIPVMLLMDPEYFDCGMNSCTVLGISRGSVPYGYWPKADGVGADCTRGLPVSFISSGDHSAPWKMVQWLRSGKVVFAYMDGNRGLEAEYSQKNSQIVSFFGADIWVRKGLAHLAGFTDAPLMFMVCRKEEGAHVVHLSPPLRRRENESLEGFCHRGVKRGFDVLEAHIRQDAACWNEWSKVHRWAVRVGKVKTSFLSECPSPDEVLQQNLRVEPHVVQLHFSGHDVLVNHKTGAAILLTPAIAEVLRLADSGSNVGAILKQLSANHGEGTLLEILHALAEDAFLQVNGS